MPPLMSCVVGNYQISGINGAVMAIQATMSVPPGTSRDNARTRAKVTKTSKSIYMSRTQTMYSYIATLLKHLLIIIILRNVIYN